jgi:hypothetical protein
VLTDALSVFTATPAFACWAVQLRFTFEPKDLASPCP